MVRDAAHPLLPIQIMCSLSLAGALLVEGQFSFSAKKPGLAGESPGFAHDHIIMPINQISGSVFAPALFFFVVAELPRRAEAALALAAEVAAESKAFCEKHGIQANTQAHANCIADVQAIRDNQAERIKPR